MDRYLVGGIVCDGPEEALEVQAETEETIYRADGFSMSQAEQAMFDRLETKATLH